MKKKKRNILLSILIGAFLLCTVAGGTFYYYLFAPQFHPSKTVYIYVDRDDTADSIYHKIKEFGHVNKFTGFQWMAKYKDFNQNIHTGRYAIRPNDNVYHVYPICAWKVESNSWLAISAESIMSCLPMLRANRSNVRTLPIVRFIGS